MWSYNYGTAAVVLFGEPAPIELIYPLNGEVIDTLIPRFEWMPIDTSATAIRLTWADPTLILTVTPTDTFIVTPTVASKVSYNLKIWQLPEDLAARIAEGYSLTEEDLSELEPYFVKEGIEGTSFVYTDTADYPLMTGITYGWQVTGWQGDWKIGESEIWSIKGLPKADEKVCFDVCDIEYILTGRGTRVTRIDGNPTGPARIAAISISNQSGQGRVRVHCECIGLFTITIRYTTSTGARKEMVVDIQCDD